MYYQQKKKRNPFLWLVILLVILGGIFFGVKSYFDSFSKPVDPDASVKAFVVQKGESMDSVAKRLEEEKIIRSTLAFKAALKNKQSFSTNRGEITIQAGDFKLSGAMSLNEIIDNLSKGPIDRWVTLLEGWRVEEVAAKFKKDLGIDEKEFLKEAKEGYMFPDTYLFNQDATVGTVASTMRNTFDKRYSEDIKTKIRAKNLTPEEGVILASLVEREARSDEVRTRVASIILKRLNMGMKLDIDATVQYGRDTNKLKSGLKVDKFWTPVTRLNYTDVISPYNTYLNNGLPPTPICNPSLSSLKAVANADPATPYLYYFHNLRGESFYARTLEEHNENVVNHR